MTTKVRGTLAEMTLPKVTTIDRRRLGTVLERFEDQRIVDHRYIDSLVHELERAESIAPEDVPADVVTMNSTVRVRDEVTGEVETYTLCYPDRANIAENRLSVLAPVGIALLGTRVGDQVKYQAPGGKIRVRVEEILYQPEAVGRFDY